jgi:tRNA A-37 threonylcarbamoyl transferase component Bud32
MDSATDGQISVYTPSHDRPGLETVHLQVAGYTYGDISERNVRVPGSSIQLIDFGKLAPNQDNDIVAMSQLLA